MASARSNRATDLHQRVCLFSPRAVTQHWSALLDSVATDAAQTHVAALFEASLVGWLAGWLTPRCA